MNHATAIRAVCFGLVCVAIAACSASLGSLPAAAPGSSAPPAAVAAAQPTETERKREEYIAHAFAQRPPAWLTGFRRVGTGTGFYIADNKVLTNFHVAGSCARLTVGNGVEGAEISATLIAGDPAADLAVIGTKAAMATPARFETALYTETGKDLAVVGYPSYGLVVLEAQLSPVSTAEANLMTSRRTYAFRGSVRPGNSGSPVLDDTGTVLGVVSAQIDTVAVYRKTGHIVDNIGLAIANQAVFRFLHAHKIAFLPPVPGNVLTSDQLLKKARQFVRQVGCWR